MTCQDGTTRQIYSNLLRSTMPKPPSYTISELAAEFGVTTRTIRHYEDEGLIRPERDGTRRIFGHRDRVRLKLALLAKRLGFTLGDVRELFELHDLATREPEQRNGFLAKLDAHRRRLEQQQADIDVMLNEIGFFAAQCRRPMPDDTTHSPAGPRVRQRNSN